MINNTLLINMLQNLDNTIFPLTLYVFEDVSSPVSDRKPFIFNAPYELVAAHIGDSRFFSIQDDLNRILDRNKVYKSWMSHFLAPSKLSQINKYLNTYSE